MAVLDDRRRRSRPVSRWRKPPSGSQSIKNILDPDCKKDDEDGEGDTRHARADDTHCLFLSGGFLPPCVTDLADVGLHIFNYFFLESHNQPFSFFLFRYLSFERTCLLSFFIMFLSLFPSLSCLLFQNYPKTCARFTPKSGYFRSEKKAKKARIRYTAA